MDSLQKNFHANTIDETDFSFQSHCDYLHGIFSNGCHLHPDCFSCPLPDCQWSELHHSSATTHHSLFMPKIKRGLLS